jgi:hypothetical protein
MTKLQTDGEIKKLHQEYLKLKILSVKSFADKHNIKYLTLLRAFRRLNLEIIPQKITKRKYQINENFFETIDTEEKAYILGFLYADGCNDEKYGRVAISLAKKDKDLLVKISKVLLNGEVFVKEYSRNYCVSGFNSQDTVKLVIANKKISHDLSKVGCVSKKTFKLTFPNIPKELHSHFIRGYFDGDGMLVIYERLMPRCINKALYAEFSILSTIEMLNEIGRQINTIGVNFKITKRHKDRDNNNYTLRIHGNQQIKKVCDFMYNGATIYLDRKHDKYLKLLDMSKSFRTNITDAQLKDFYVKNKNLPISKIARIINVDRHTLSKRIKLLGLK